jgi:hypothetical protein
MKAYFFAIHEAYPSAWAQKVLKGNDLVYSSYYYQYILCKTTGLGAYFRLIRYIYPKVAEERNSYKENILKIFRKMSDDQAKTLFSKQGPYGGSGSEGLQDKLFKHLLSVYELSQ